MANFNIFEKLKSKKTSKKWGMTLHILAYLVIIFAFIFAIYYYAITIIELEGTGGVIILLIGLIIAYLCLIALIGAKTVIILSLLTGIFSILKNMTNPETSILLILLLVLIGLLIIYLLIPLMSYGFGFNLKTVEKFKPKQLSKNWRITLNVLFPTVAVAAAFVAYYEIIDYVELKTTSALFIGLPILIGLLVVNFAHTKSVFGMTIKTTIISLCLIAPFLGEGSICILMAAPIFLLVNLVLVAIYQSIKRKYQSIKKKYLILLLTCIPFFMGFIEKNSLTKKQEFLKVTTETIVEGTLEQWQVKISNSTHISENVPMFLSLGFPLPTKISDHNSQLLITFDKGGFWKVNKEVKKGSIKYTVIKDTSKINHWIKIKDSHLEIIRINNQRVLIKQTTSYYSKVFPKWYFAPFQKLAIKQLHQFAILSWKRT